MDFLRTVDGCSSPAAAVRPTSGSDRTPEEPNVHTWHCEETITAVAAFDRLLFSGTVSGVVHVYDLDTYANLGHFEAHKGSVLVLVVREGVLFSGSSDSLVKVWEIATHGARIPILRHTVYSIFDVGDVFSVEYVPSLRMLYFGTQSAAISWVRLPGSAAEDGFSVNVTPIAERTRRLSHQHPAVRPNKFFDSAGPGGRLAPPQHEKRQMLPHIHADSTLIEVPASNCVNFAHNGYVYAMVSTLVKEGTNDAAAILATGAGDGMVKIWKIDAVSGILYKIHETAAEDSVLTMTLARTWQLYCGLGSGDCLVLDLETLQFMSYNVAKGSPLLAVTSANNLLFAASGKKILEYDPAFSTVSTWETTDDITALVALPNMIASASRDGSVSLWRVGESTEAPIRGLYQDGSWKGLGDRNLDADTMINVLDSLVQFESVSGRDRQHWSESRRCASAFSDLFRALGAQAELLPVDEGNPIVFAHFTANSPSSNAKRPGRVLFYGHYDVIAANAESWDSSPFRLSSRDGYMYGRGVSDNKGPCIASLWAVATLHFANRLANDVVFLIEGEEESGSFGFQKTIEQHQKRIGKIDWVIFSNSYWINDTRPCLNYGLRGVVFAQVQVHNDKSDAHSGVDGGVFREPAIDLINLLAKLTKDTGEISVPGFTNSVLPLTEHEDSLYEEITKTEGFSSTKAELMSKWRNPSLTVHKIEVSGPGNQTVIPSTVTAFVSARLVPNQTAAEIKEKLETYLRESFKDLRTPNKLRVTFRYDADPWLGDAQNDAFQILKAAITEEWGVEPLFVREGGTIPMARALEKIFDAPAAQIPVGQSSDNAHLNNERLRVRNFLAAEHIFARLFSSLGPRTDDAT